MGIMTQKQAEAMLEEIRDLERGDNIEAFLESLSELDELTEEATQSAFDNEVMPWLRRRMEALLRDQLDKEMYAMMRGQAFPEQRMEYGITRYAPLSQGPKAFLKALGKPYRMWRAKVLQAIEGK